MDCSTFWLVVPPGDGPQEAAARILEPEAGASLRLAARCRLPDEPPMSSVLRSRVAGTLLSIRVRQQLRGLPVTVWLADQEAEARAAAERMGLDVLQVSRDDLAGRLEALLGLEHEEEA